MRKKIYLPLFEKTEAKLIFFKIIFILILCTIFYFLPKRYLEETYPICLFKLLFNTECIGCGTTRAVWSVIHFKFYDAINYNKLIVITFPLLTICIIKWIFKKDKIHNL